jgi:cytochrome b561
MRNGDKKERTMFDKSKVNFVIDALMFLCMMAMAGIGFLMKFILIPGKDRWVEYGRNVELYLFGMDRHQWGTIHLTIGFALLGLLVIHIVLHWRKIVNLYKSLIGNKMARKIIASVFIIACAILIAFPFILRPEVQETGRGERRGQYGYLDTRGWSPENIPR